MGYIPCKSPDVSLQYLKPPLPSNEKLASRHLSISRSARRNKLKWPPALEVTLRATCESRTSEQARLIRLCSAIPVSPSMLLIIRPVFLFTVL